MRSGRVLLRSRLGPACGSLRAACVAARVGAALTAGLSACRHLTFTPGCDEVSTELTWDEVSPLGFSADQALGQLRSTWSADATTLISERTPLLLSVQGSGVVSLVERQDTPVPDNATVVGSDQICDDYLALGLDLTLSTGDGQLDAQLSTTLAVPDPAGERAPKLSAEGLPTWATFSTQLDATQLGGELNLSGYDLGGYDSATLVLRGVVWSDGSTDGVAELDRQGHDAHSNFNVVDEVTVWGAERSAR